MPPVYVVEQGAQVGIGRRRLEVRKGGEVLLSVPLVHVSEVVLFGNIGLTTPAVHLLLKRGIPVTFLSSRGAFRGRLTGATTPHVALRQAQYRQAADSAFSLALAQALVEAKLRHQRALLQRQARRLEAGQAGALREAAQALDRALARVPRTTRHTSLAGVEGSATAAYFGGLRTLFGPEWRFERRARRPPPDPVNALLSLGYTLLAEAARGAVETVGLDPYAGFLHQVAYNRPSLALDLMEEFRPVVDGLVLWCCRGGAVRPEDFTPGPATRPVVMSPEATRRFIQAYEGRMERPVRHPVTGEQMPLRRALEAQARQIARAVQRGRPEYRPMGFR